VAVRLCEPTASAEVLNAAELPERVPDPSNVAPSKKFTVPVGVPPEEVTVAVSVTLSLNVEGFGADVRTVAVGAEFTVWVLIGDVDDAKFAVAM